MKESVTFPESMVGEGFEPKQSSQESDPKQIHRALAAERTSPGNNCLLRMPAPSSDELPGSGCSTLLPIATCPPMPSVAGWPEAKEDPHIHMTMRTEHAKGISFRPADRWHHSAGVTSWEVCQIKPHMQRTKLTNTGHGAPKLSLEIQATEAGGMHIWG